MAMSAYSGVMSCTLVTPSAAACRSARFTACEALLVRKIRDHFVDVVHRGIFQRARGIALRVAHDGAAGKFRSAGRDARKPQRCGVCDAHVPVVAAEEHGVFRRDAIDDLFRRKLGGIPLGFVPIAAENPFAFRRDLRAFGNSASELLGACGVGQLNGVELRAAADEVHMCVVESRQEQLAAGIDHLGLRPAPRVGVRVRAHCNDPFAENCDCLRCGHRSVDRPDLRILDDQIGRGLRFALRERSDK